MNQLPPKLNKTSTNVISFIFLVGMIIFIEWLEGGGHLLRSIINWWNSFD